MANASRALTPARPLEETSEEGDQRAFLASGPPETVSIDLWRGWD